jgi:hypothetical protein
MSRASLVGLVGLFVLAAMAAPRPAAATDVGPTPYIMSIGSGGPSMQSESIQPSRAGTKLDHQGPGWW